MENERIPQVQLIMFYSFTATSVIFYTQHCFDLIYSFSKRKNNTFFKSI